MGFWDDDSEEGQKWKNFVLFKIWATDKDMEEMSPFFFWFIVVILALVCILFLVKIF
jgi:hypothetical protein